MAIAIDASLLDNVSSPNFEPSFELVNYCIEKHQKELPRLKMLADYYEGKPHKINKVSDNTPHDKDEVYVNLAKYVTDLMTGFTVGNPVSYSDSDEHNIELITQALAKIKIAKHDIELAKGLSVLGYGLELHYLSIDDRTGLPFPNVAWIDPRGMFLVVDDTVERKPLFAVRYTEKEDLQQSKFYEFEIYTKTRKIVYRSASNRLVVGQSGEPVYYEHFYNDVPVVEFRNNEEKQGDFEQNLSQIDGYNLLQTDRIKDKKNFVKALMVLYGFTLPDEKPQEMAGSMVMNAPSKQDGATAEYITKTFDESQVQVLVDSLLDDFHKTTYIPNLNDENFAGTQSGQAMRFKLLGLLLALSVKTSYFEDGIIRRLRLIENVLNVKGANINTDTINIKFKVNLPFDRKDVIDQINASQDFVPLLISLGWLDDVDNPQELIEMLREQQEANIERQRKLFGVQAQRSHSDLEEEDDDTSDDQEEE